VLVFLLSISLSIGIHEDAVARWELAVKQNQQCTFSEADQKLVDQRVKNLVGPAKWIKNSMVCVHMRLRIQVCMLFSKQVCFLCISILKRYLDGLCVFFNGFILKKDPLFT
jgi:hypothetical protein